MYYISYHCTEKYIYFRVYFSSFSFTEIYQFSDGTSKGWYWKSWALEENIGSVTQVITETTSVIKYTCSYCYTTCKLDEDWLYFTLKIISWVKVISYSSLKWNLASFVCRWHVYNFYRMQCLHGREISTSTDKVMLVKKNEVNNEYDWINKLLCLTGFITVCCPWCWSLNSLQRAV